MNEEYEENEAGIRDVMADGIGEEPPVVVGPARVFAQARRVRIRQRSLTGALSVVAVIGVAAGIAAVSGGTGHRGAAVSAAGSTSTSAAAPSTDGGAPAPTAAGKSGHDPAPLSTAGCTPWSPASSATHAPAQGSAVPMDARSALELVKQLLPKGFTTSNYAGQDYPGDPGTYSEMAFNDGHGKSGIGVNANQHIGPGDIPGGDCRALPDGSVVYVSSLNDDKPVAGHYPSLGMSVRRCWSDGNCFAIQEFNYFQDEFHQHPKGWKATATRGKLPLSTDQLLAIVADDRWGPSVPAAFAAQARRDLVPFYEGK